MRNYTNSRRKFLKNIGLTSLGVSSLPASIFQLETWAACAANNSSIASTEDYKALVCFYMFGGNDGFNMLVPRSGDPYAEYNTIRGNLALNAGDLLDINPLDNPLYSSPELGLHPQLSGVRQLFNEQKLSFLTNVGPKKIDNTTIDNVANQQNVPLSLFSHSDQARQWHTAEVQARSHIGWAGKIADMLSSTYNTNTNISMNISLFNNALFLNGEDKSSFTLSSSQGAIESRLYNPGSTSGYFHARTAALDSMYQHDYQNLFYNNFNSIIKNGMDTNIEYQAALNDFEASGGLNTVFTEAGGILDFKTVAKSIAIAEDLGFKRQIYFVHVGGFDNHDDLLLDHSSLMSRIDTGLVEFNAALEELGKQESVVTFSMSDFGRTLTSNGSGSDHAWGSNAIVMGGPVVGKSLFGNYPALTLDNEDMVYSNKGILIPEMASDLYFAELALWFGVPMSDLGLILPNIAEFFDTSLGNQPLGFLTL